MGSVEYIDGQHLHIVHCVVFCYQLGRSLWPTVVTMQGKWVVVNMLDLHLSWWAVCG